VLKNIPAASLGGRVIRADGLGIPLLLEAILGFLPLDQYANLVPKKGVVR
jgi:L-fucose mutarotase